MHRALAILASHGVPLTVSGRDVLVGAHHEAERLKHDYDGTEHLVLALSRHGIGDATLASLGIDAEDVLGRITIHVEPGRSGQPFQELERPYTSRTKKVFSFAAESARNLRHSHVGVQHFILGLMREGMNIGATVLQQCGLTLENAAEYASREHGGA